MGEGDSQGLTSRSLHKSQYEEHQKCKAETCIGTRSRDVISQHSYMKRVQGLGLGKLLVKDGLRGKGKKCGVAKILPHETVIVNC